MNRRSLVLVLTTVTIISLIASASGQNAIESYQRSKAAKDAGNFEFALKEIRVAVRAAPRDDGLLDWQSWIEYLLGDYEDGLSHAQQAARIRSTSTDHVSLIGLNAQGVGDLILARQAFRYVLGRGARDPHYTDAGDHLDRLTGRTYTIDWEIDPAKVRLVDGAILIPYPVTDDSQVCTLSVQGASSCSERTIGGNRALVVVPNGTNHFSLALDAQMKPYSYRDKVTKYDGKLPAPPEVIPFLGETGRINPATPAVRQIVSQLPTGQTPIKRVRSIQLWLKQNFTYEFTAGNFSSVDQLLSTRRAECGGYSSTAAALLRASGIPARVVWVLTKSPGVAPPGHLKGHAIAEFWLPGANCWVPFDPQQGDSIGIRFCDVIRMCHQSPDMAWLSEALMQADGDMPVFSEKVDSIK